MTLVLESARAKLGRAHKHFEELKSQLMGYLGSNPHKITHEFDEKQHLWISRIHVLKPIPTLEWALLIGDCVHNARSALDHAAWQLAWVNDPGGPANDTRTMFPIFDDRKLWKTRGAEKRIARLHLRVRALVKWLQPYRRRNPAVDLLAILNTLDNEDKHKVLAITVAVVEPSRVLITMKEGQRLPFGFRYGPFDDGAIIAHVGPFEIRPDDVPMKIDLTVDVAFRDIAGPNHAELPVGQGLYWVLNCVERVLGLFEKYGDVAPLPPSTG